MILDRRPGSDHLGGRGLRGWGRGPKPTVSEYGHVAYQIKENDACSNMVANMSPETFSEYGNVAYQIKENNACSNITGGKPRNYHEIVLT